MTWVLGEPGGEGTGAKRRKRPKHVRLTHVRHRVYRVSPSAATGGWTGSWTSRTTVRTCRQAPRPTTGRPASGRGAEMVVGWG